MSQRTKGILCIIASAFCFALMNTFVRLAGELPSFQKSFFRNLVAFFVAMFILLREHKGFRLKKDCIPYHLLRSGFGTIGILCNFYAIDHLALSNASILNKMSPFFVLIFSYFILKEKLTAAQIGIVVTAFIGALFIIKPTPTNLELVPSLIGLAGGLCAGFAYTMVRAMGLRGERGGLIVFFFSGFSCLSVLPFMISSYEPMTTQQLISLLFAGLSAAGGQFGITKAYTYAPAKEVSVYDYSQIIFSALLGYFIFNQLPDGWSFIGYLLIIGAAVVMFFYNNRHHEPKSAR